jgi:predicted NUDIX family phosphoesterase
MEFVFVVPRAELFPDCTPHGLQVFGAGSTQERFEALVASHGYFVERAWAERTPSVKQIIPYSIATRRNEILLLRRTKRGGESRLHDKLSLGVGGHVEPVDLSTGESVAPRRSPLARATEREIREELDLAGGFDILPVGLLNDDTNPVGAVHLGLVQILAVEGTCEVRETDQLEGRWITLAHLREMEAAGANLESWSRMLVPHLETLFARTEAARVS